MAVTVALSLSPLAYSADTDDARFWAPRVPLSAYHKAQCTINPARNTMTGMEEIHLKNSTKRTLHRLMLRSSLTRPNGHEELALQVAGHKLQIVADREFAIFDLPSPLPPGESTTISVDFTVKDWPAPGENTNEVICSEFLPRLWWGYETHNDYEVSLKAPNGYALATSGLFDSDSGTYNATGVRSFGLYMAKNRKVLEQQTGNVTIRALHKPENKACAKLLLETAVDVVNFYRKQFGFYPSNTLNIIPGRGSPGDGWPVATNLVAINGQQSSIEGDTLPWRWITAHEIGHQYWGEHVLEREERGWLWIGLGVYSDRQYIRARGLGLSEHKDMLNRYISGMQQGLDTTAARTAEQINALRFDWNNVVRHGKGFSIISALACFMGKENFNTVLQHCLAEYGGKRLGPNDLQRICEEQSSEDLDWFFNQWVRSNRYLACEIASQETVKSGDRFLTRVQVEQKGSLTMPVPVEARFEDGSLQRLFTDRFSEISTLEFHSAAMVREVVIDPDEELAMVIPPPPPAKEIRLRRRISELSWSGCGGAASDLFPGARKIDNLDAHSWGKLAINLYDGLHYEQALEAFERCAESAADDPWWLFVGTVWQGHVLDILGKREEALKRYRLAIERDTGIYAVHSQYNMTIDQAWVQQRLKTAFTRAPATQ